MKRESSRAPKRPVNEPANASHIPCRTTSSRTCARVAPSDIRTPISWVLREAE